MAEEARKRQSEQVIDKADVKKRKPLDELSEDGPLTQEDVVYFQKEAIFRQMKLYRKETVLLDRKLNRFKAKYSINEKKLSILNNWYSQIVQLLLSKGLKTSAVTDDLLSQLPNEQGEADKVLDERRQALLQVLTPIINKESISNPEKRSLLEQIESLTNDLSVVTSDKESLQNEAVLLNDTIDSLNHEILDLVKEKERLESKSLKRVDESFKKDEDDEELASVEEKNGANGSVANGNGTIKKEESLVNNEELEKLNFDLEELRATNSTLSKQLELELKSSRTLKDETEHLAFTLANLGDREVEGSSIFTHLRSNYQRLQEEIAELKTFKVTSTARLQELENERVSFKDTLEKSLAEETDILKQQLSKCEADLTRIRTARDELLGKISIMKSESENKELISELKNLIQLQKNRIDSLESETPSNSDAVDDSLTELNQQQLVKKVQLLSTEIKELEAAFKSTHQLSIKKLSSLSDTDALINKLTVEKAKADQKYFAAMRSKDALSQELKTVKLQLGKSSELVNQLKELEKFSSLKLDNLKQIENDLKLVVSSKDDELRSIKPKFIDLESKYEKQKLEIVDKTKKLEAMQQDMSLTKEKLQTIEVNNSKVAANLKSTQSLLEKYKSNNTSALLQEDESMLTTLRGIAKCSLCTNNFKDTAIKVCGHVFCNKCAQERLAARLRKCPLCNKQFSSNDLLHLHL